VRRIAAALALSLLALAASTARAGTPAWQPARVTVIADSVGGVLFWADPAREQLGAGLDLRVEAATCRRLVGPGCFAYGIVPTSALERIEQLGRELGPVVVVDVGYNDVVDGYKEKLDEVMRALVAAGVQHVVWVTLTESYEMWAGINALIREAPERWPQLVVADWARASAGKPWLVDDAHLNGDGAFAFAAFLRPIVLSACGETCAPPPPLEISTAALPVARAGRPYAAALSAEGGVPPYRWRATAPLPHGLHLTADGRVFGTPRSAAVLAVSVADSYSDRTAGSVTLRVRGGPHTR
jgi:hypothetical protein